MSYLFCEGRQEAIELEEKANAEKGKLLDEFMQYIRTPGKIGINVRRRFCGMCWSVEADLTYNGEVVQSFESYDLLVLALNEMELSILQKQIKRDTMAGDKEKKE